MRFIIANEFSREPDKQGGLRVTGMVALAVLQAGEELCQKSFAVDFYSNSPSLGERCTQTIEVRDGQGVILSEEGMLDEHHEPALDEEMKLAYGLFMNQVVQYLHCMGPVRFEIDESDFSAPVAEFLLRLCRGPLNT